MIYQYHPSLAWWLQLLRESAPMAVVFGVVSLALTCVVWLGVEVILGWRKR